MLEKSYYGEPIGSHQRSFERCRPRHPTASPSPRLGFTTRPQNCNAIISGTLKLRTAMADTFTGSIRTQAHKKFGEKGAWAYPGTAQIFWVPPIISGTGKATNFKFCKHILSIDENKSPLQISWKVAVCVVRTLETFQDIHVFGASRGLLCDSSAVLLSIFTRFRDIDAFVLQHATFPHPDLVSPKFLHVPLELGGWPLGYKERRCCANSPCN